MAKLRSGERKTLAEGHPRPWSGPGIRVQLFLVHPLRDTAARKRLHTAEAEAGESDAYPPDRSSVGRHAMIIIIVITFQVVTLRT